jgi:tellurite resistance-related uncharacterized protein
MAFIEGYETVSRFLVQYLTQGGAWADACTVTGDIAFFDTEEAADEYVDQQNIDAGNIRVVPLRAGV